MMFTLSSTPNIYNWCSFLACLSILLTAIWRSFPHSWLITGFVPRLTRRVPLVELKLLTLPQHLSSPLVFSEIRSLVLYVCFVDRCLSFYSLSFGHCVVCSSSIYGFWLPIWCLQTLLIQVMMATIKLSKLPLSSIQ